MNKICDLDLGAAGHLSVVSSGERSKDNREIFTYTITNGQGEVITQGSDLMSGVGGEAQAEKMMASLLSFLGAAAEANEPASDNWDLFNAPTREWAKANADEIAILEAEMDAQEMDVV